MPRPKSIPKGILKSTKDAFEQALGAAARTAGSTSPNPCVGAAALDEQGTLLGVEAHERAGLPHAEAKLIEALTRQGRIADARTLVVTLEPCNHQGRTPPCTDAILRAGFRTVYFGARDPNPRVAGDGALMLRQAGLEVFGPSEILGLDPSSQLPARCEELIRAFSHWSRTGLPWVTLKVALTSAGSMIPSEGQKTFTSPESLRLAHELRKRADAILTGSETVLADQPLFTVRHVPDHPGKSRWLVVLDRRGRLSSSLSSGGNSIARSFVNQAESNGFRVYFSADIDEALRFLGSQGVLEVLVEAGPTLTQTVESRGIWNEFVLIQQRSGAPDQVEIRVRKS